MSRLRNVPCICSMVWVSLCVGYAWVALASTILLADDEDPIVRLFTHVMEKEGYSVVSVGSSSQALRVLAERGQEIDALVLDVKLPPGGAEEVLAALRSLGLEFPCVLVSGAPIQGILKEYVSGRQADFLQKPFRPQHLLDWLEEVLARCD